MYVCMYIFVQRLRVYGMGHVGIYSIEVRQDMFGRDEEMENKRADQSSDPSLVLY